MSRFLIQAERLIDGRTEELDRIVSVRAEAMLDSPAMSLTAQLVCERPPAEYGAVRLYWGTRMLFQGRADRQTAVIGGEGILLRLEARSKGALLLDNEAVPCALANVRLSTIFNLFVKPYDFVLYNPNHAGMLASYVVRKDTSEWEALTGYTRRVYGITPYVTGDQVMVDRPRSAVPLVIGGSELPYIQLVQSYTPYNIISKVILRDGDGQYSTAVSNSGAPYYGARRKRYVIPSNEFMDNAALDANGRIKRSMLEKEQVTVTLPGIVDCHIGQEVAVRDKLVTLHNLLAGEIRWGMDAGGVTTRLTLVSSVYYA